MRKFILIPILLFLFCSCEKGNENLVHPEFQTYVDRFYNEAASRDVHLSRELEVVFSDVFPSDFCGYGYPSTHPPLIRIRNTELCWTDRTDTERESIIFHELGHAVLNRSHTSKSFNGGYASSIMCTSLDGDFCNNYQVYYNDEMRSYFLDELFNNFTPPPSWSMNEVHLGTIFSDTITTLDNWEFYDSDGESDDYNSYIDEENFNDSKSLAIEKLSDTANDAYGFFVKRFEIGSFPNCSSLKVKALIKSLDRFNGYVAIGISLREVNLNGELHRFAHHEYRQTNPNRFTNAGIIETELFCIPEKTEVVSVSVSLKSSTISTILIDDIVVELWN